MYVCNLILIVSSCIVLSVCLNDGRLYNTAEITWLDDPNNYTIEVDFQNTTISLCNPNKVCQYVSSISTDSQSSQPLSLLIQKGVNLRIKTTPVTMSLFHRVSTTEFQLCSILDHRNDTSSFLNVSSENFTLSRELLVDGENLFICDRGIKEDNKSCPIDCRLNITVKDTPCSPDFARNLCFDNGNCSSRLNETGFTCKCNTGYTGEACETDLDDTRLETDLFTEQDQELDQELNTDLDTELDTECMIKNCMNGGTCVPILSPTNSSDRTRCECPLHVSGELCETVLNSCTSSPCANGVCVEKTEGYQCFCVPGFHGTKCELEYNECLSNPCLNSGTCIDRVDKYECRCISGFRGINCEHKINYCESSPCKHNASCLSLDDTFHCKCTHGHTGQLCEHRIRECSSSPCKNHGTCVEFNHGYKCLCPVTFAGLHCEYMMDVFAPPMEGTGLSGDSHKHNLYIVAATLGSMILIIVSVIIACYCKIYETYKQVMWKRLRYHRKRSNSCPDMESCNESATINKHRLSADAIWEATSLCHDNAAFEHHGNNHQTFNTMQI